MIEIDCKNKMRVKNNLNKWNSSNYNFWDFICKFKTRLDFLKAIIFGNYVQRSKKPRHLLFQYGND